MDWLRVICLSASFLLAPVSAHSQVLWQTAQFGMTVDGVLKAVPGSSKYDPAPGDKLGDGALELVRGPTTQIANEDFLPEFFFQNGHLEQVTLSLQSVDTASNARLVFANLTTALRARYGQEISARPTAIGLDSEWLSGKTNVTLILIAIGDTDPLLNIVYQVRLAGDASKL